MPYVTVAMTAPPSTPKLPAKQPGAATWAWGTGETAAVAALMIAGYRTSGRLARRRTQAARVTTASGPDDLSLPVRS